MHFRHNYETRKIQKRAKTIDLQLSNKTETEL